MASHSRAASTPTRELFIQTQHEEGLDLPEILEHESFPSVVRKLSHYFEHIIDSPYAFEQLRTSSVGRRLKPLVLHLAQDTRCPSIVSALLALKWHYGLLEPDDRGVNETRGLACEIVAWRLLTHLNDHEVVDVLLYELPRPSNDSTGETDLENGQDHGHDVEDFVVNERTRLINTKRRKSASFKDNRSPTSPFYGNHLPEQSAVGEQDDAEEYNPFIGLNALEVAAVANAKKFLSQIIVLKIVNGIWRGDIMFWESFGVHTKKKAQFYDKGKADPFCRLRVPRYQKIFEVVFFATFLVLYYAVLVERDPRKITPIEMLLYIWIAAFAYEEFSEFRDAGTLFYSADFWSVWDLGIICVGAVYLITRIIGLLKGSNVIIDTAFDILSLEALFLVPRICSLLSLHPYFGTLIPCLKEMTKDFVKFLGIVAILYIGFLTTFTLLARDSFSLSEMSWILIKVFFGSSYLGFDVMREISPVLGPPLMLIFVCMTNILLITSLISLLSNSLTKVMDHAREEYLFIYSVYVLEASTSNRLTHFYPPLNLIPLVLLRPLRLCMPAERVRQARIKLLKITHVGYLLAILAFERWHAFAYGGERAFGGGGAGGGRSERGPHTALTKRPFLGGSRRSALRGPTPLGLNNANTASPSKHNSLGPDELARMVTKLTTQMEELKAAFASQQG